MGRFRKGKKKERGDSTEESSKEDASSGKAAGGKEQETTTSGEGKRSSTTDHDDLGASFVYGTMMGGIGAVNIVDGVSRKAWFIPPPHSGEAR